MNPEIKAKWLEALRSGKYEQGTSYLRDGESYCCLGVLCEISGLNDWVPTEALAFHYNASLTSLPVNVMGWSGLKSGDPLISEIGRTLGALNDIGRSFEEIADYIEKYL